MPKPLSWAVLLVSAACCGCATARTQVCVTAPPEPTRGIVFAVPGAGNFPGLSTSLHQALAADHVPLAVEDVAWTHPNGRFLADQTDYAYVRDQGGRLAARIAAYRQACPKSRIYVVAHSAGSAVALAAAEGLPADTVDRIILLAPAVSADYDLRCALRSARQGLDVFTSERDRFYLGLGTALLGTTDRQWTAAAGRVGFRPVITSAEDTALYSRLRQHPWDCCVGWTGNTGGHSGSFRLCYLRAYVLPLLRAE